MIIEHVKKFIKRTPAYLPLRRAWYHIRGNSLRSWLHDYRVERFYKNVIPAGALCFDVGANIGSRTAAMRTVGARVVAIEPQLSCAQILRLRYAADNNVVVEQVAVGSRESHMKLAKIPGKSAFATLSPEWQEHGPFADRFSGAEYEDVRVVTLDWLIHRHGLPNFCKIDVEEYEDQVLAGLSQPISLISFEYHRAFLDKVRRCIKYLESLGVAEFNYSPEESMRFELMSWVKGQDLLQRLDDIADDEHGWGDIYARFT